MTTTPPDRPSRTAHRRSVTVKQTRAALRTRELVELLQRHPELAGVYRPADLAVEAIRWSA